MTQRLLAAGHTVHVYNRSRGATDALAKEGATPADSAGQVAERAEIVMTALPTPDSVQAVFTDMAARARPGQIYIDHSTVSPGLNRWCAEQRFSEARARGMGDEDMAALVKLWEEPAGVTLDRVS